MSINRIIIHHTGGTWFPNETDKKCYHYIISGDGNVYNGRFSPEANIPPLVSGMYAAHTRLGNSNTIGIAVACNYNYSITNKEATAWPLTEKQFNVLIDKVVELMHKYNITNVNKVFTHYWFDMCNGIKQGKSDITYIPWQPELQPDDVIYYIRDYIKSRL